MGILGLDTKNVRLWNQLSMLSVTLHYTKSSNSWSFQYHQIPRHCDCKIITATFPSFQQRDRLEGGETNIQLLYGLILQVERQLFPFSGFLWIMPLRGYKRPHQTQIQHSSWAACLYTAFSLDTACSVAFPDVLLTPSEKKTPWRLTWFLKRENLAMSEYSSPCLFLEEGDSEVRLLEDACNSLL